MNINEIYQSSDALKAEDLQGKEWTLTIKAVEVRTFEDNGIQKTKPCISFVETEKTFICNRTNTFVIAEWCGDDTDQWAGKTVIAFPTKTSFGTKMVDCIRFKMPIVKMPEPAPTKTLDQPASNETGQTLGERLADEIPF